MMTDNSIVILDRSESSSAALEEPQFQHSKLNDWIHAAFDFKWNLASSPQSTNYIVGFESDLVDLASVQVAGEPLATLGDWSQLIAGSLELWETDWKITHELLGQALPMRRKRSVLSDAPVDVEIKDRKVISIFGQVPAVHSVFRDRVRDGLLYWIFTSNGEYDSVLMDELIFREMRVIDSFGDEGISFRFIPSIASASRREVVGRHATLIFEK